MVSAVVIWIGLTIEAFSLPVLRPIVRGEARRLGGRARGRNSDRAAITARCCSTTDADRRMTLKGFSTRLRRYERVAGAERDVRASILRMAWTAGSPSWTVTVAR